jgi:hypothetical protein
VIQTQDEQSALVKACDDCEAFQTKSKIFEAGWIAHKNFMQDKVTTLKTLRELSLERDLQLIVVCAREVAIAVSNSGLYLARERLRKVLEYFKD